MEYRYKCDVKAKDLWELSMRRTYRSMAGIVNVVFTVAMILLTLKYWGGVSDLMRTILLAGCLLFPVIQPIATYGMCVKQLEDLPGYLDLAFDAGGVYVTTDGGTQTLSWSRITNAIRQKNMIVVMSDDRHGYILTNRVLGKEKEEFFDYLCRQIKH
ncbi:YcxB family protein [Butyrivibrio sp. FCS014]|uniref:YcxB family protein n=1 Tax=Butyrivibrio sp. FCS014 TaxID=1408304 RepID=UPI000464DD7C|nr:YcxB family protein [Butyrivibrio sp. FCS014]